MFSNVPIFPGDLFQRYRPSGCQVGNGCYVAATQALPTGVGPKYRRIGGTPSRLSFVTSGTVRDQRDNPGRNAELIPILRYLGDSNRQAHIQRGAEGD